MDRWKEQRGRPVVREKMVAPVYGNDLRILGWRGTERRMRKTAG